MEKKLQKQIVDYFSFFEESYNKSKTCLKICQNCAISINKTINRCRNIKEAQVVGTPLEEFVGLQSNLLSALHNLISEEILEIQKQRSVIEELFEQLCYKNKVLLESAKDIDLAQKSLLIQGTPLQPPLEQLLEFAADTISYGAQICAQIETSLNVLSLKGLNTEFCVENFQISTDWRARIPEIIAYTSFCSENEI